MKYSTRVSRSRFAFGRSGRALITATIFIVGALVVMSTFFSASVSTTKVAAAQAEFAGGATSEMLAYALNFGQASDFAVFGGRHIGNRGNSIFRGRVGSGGTMEGVPGTVDGESTENYGQAKQDMKNALNWISQLPCQQVADAQLGGKTFGPGVYCLPSSELTGELTLTGAGDPNARFVFRIKGTFTAAAEANIRLIEGARATSVYIVTTDDVTLGADSSINANILADGSITVSNHTTVTGKTIGLDQIEIQESNLGDGTGFIEICKALSPGDPIPTGTIFNFTVAGVAGNIQVPAGGCSAPINVAAGNVTVTEAARANTAVIGVVTNPANRRVSFDLALRQVVVAVPEGGVTDQTVITFTNQTTRTGTIEICKRALDADVTGFFQFTVQGAPGQTFSVPVGFCTGPITVTILQAPNTPFTTNVTELARPNYRLENVTTFPANRLTGPFTPNQGFDANGNPIMNVNGGFANIALVSGGGPNQQTTVNFFNRSLPGVIKVCKITADPTTIPVGTSFRFTVSGLAPTSPTQTLPGVQVTRTVDVLAGPDSQGGFCQFVEGTFVVGEDVTIVETGLTPGQTLPGGLTFADTRVSRIRATTPILSSSLATRTVVIDARNTTAEVDFTNFVFRPAILKVCKIAGAGVPAGTNFTFSLSLVNPLTSLPVNTAPFSIPAGSCTFVSGPFPEDPNFPGIGTFNFGTQIVVTEAAATGFTLTAVTSPTGNPITVSLPNRTGTLTLNQALLPNSLFNEIAFTNAATTTPPTGQAAVRFDFDGDRKSDPVIFRPGTGVWWYAASGSGGQVRAVQFGLSTDKVVAADYDGDGRTDFAVYRNGEWHVLGSTAGYSVRVFGLAGDIPQPGDYDGDGLADTAVYRPSDGIWYIMGSRDGFMATRFGLPTDRPVAADFDGDRRMDPAVYRDGVWYILGSTAGFSAAQFGLSGDRPVAADYDGDGRADIAVFRNGGWHILRTGGGGYLAFMFGMSGDEPVPADYNGDGKTDVAVYRPSNNVWHVLASSSAESTYNSFQFGSNGDVLMNY